MQTEITSKPVSPIRRDARRPSLIIWFGVTLGLMFMSADFQLVFRPMDYLGMPYPHVLKYLPFILPAIGFALAVVCKRSNLIAISTWILWTLAVMAINRWVEAQPIKIHVTRMIDSHEFKAWEKSLGFKVWEMGDQSGVAMWVDRTAGRAAQVTQEVKRMGIWRP